MAQRAEARPQAPEVGADDLNVLHPDLPAKIAGRSIVVREYGFIEGLRLRPLLQPFLDDLHAVTVGGGLPELEGIVAIIGKHADAISEAICVATGVELEWLESLSQDDGQHLLMLWWSANGPFYIRSVFQRIVAERAVTTRHAGEASTQPLSEQDTATPTRSGE